MLYVPELQPARGLAGGPEEPCRAPEERLTPTSPGRSFKNKSYLVLEKVPLTFLLRHLHKLVAYNHLQFYVHGQ